MPNPENIDIAVGIALISSLEAEIRVYVDVSLKTNLHDVITFKDHTICHLNCVY